MAFTLVAEHAAPAGTAVAFPGCITVAVHAARIRETLVALRPSPAHLAAGTKKCKLL